MKKIISIIFVFAFISTAIAQETNREETDKKAINASQNLTWEGNKDISENNFITAEANYRRAISKNSNNVAASHNLGNAYYNKENYSEAFGRFKQAGETADSKIDKHSAYHNMGNVYMKRKEYEKAVEAYKESLRNNPKDEETRYNLALAKEMLKKQQEEEKKNDQNKDDQDKEDKEDEKDKNQDNKDEGDKDKEDKGEQKEDENKDEGEEGDKGEEKHEENKEGEGDKKEEEKKQPNEGDKPQEQKPRPNQLSPQQVQNLLEAMQNEEKKVQEKIDAKKMKGVKIKNEKDW